MTDINIGAITEALNDKMDRDANNIESPKLPIFLVDVQYPTADNNYTWYRKYSDGWVEQGGEESLSGTNSLTINLIIEFSDTNYNIQITKKGPNSGNNNASWCYYNKTTNSFGYRQNDSSGQGCCWMASGKAAS